MRRVRCATVGAGAAWEAAFVTVCGDSSAGVEMVGRFVELGELLARLRLDPPEAVVCDADVPWLDADAVAEIRSCGAAAIGVPGQDANRATRLGFTALVAPDDPAVVAGVVVEVARPLDATALRMGDATTSGGDGVVVGIWGPKGGTGRTTVAVNLAWELAFQGAECVLVDADTYGGSVALALDVEERPNVATLARAVGSGRGLTDDDVDSLPSPVERLTVVPGLARSEAWPDLRGTDLSKLLGELRKLAQVVVVDVGACLEDDEELVLAASPWRRNQAARAALACAERVYAVVACDPASVRQAVLRADELASSAGGGPDRVRTLANRARTRRAGRQVNDELQSRCGWVPTAVLAEDGAALDAMWQGRPLALAAPRSAIRRDIAVVAEELGADWACGRLRRCADTGRAPASIPAVRAAHEVTT